MRLSFIDLFSLSLSLVLSFTNPRKLHNTIKLMHSSRLMQTKACTLIPSRSARENFLFTLSFVHPWLAHTHTRIYDARRFFCSPRSMFTRKFHKAKWKIDSCNVQFLVEGGNWIIEFNKIFEKLFYAPGKFSPRAS